MGGLQKDIDISNFEIFESTLYMKSGSMPLSEWDVTMFLQVYRVTFSKQLKFVSKITCKGDWGIQTILKVFWQLRDIWDDAVLSYSISESTTPQSQIIRSFLSHYPLIRWLIYLFFFLIVLFIFLLHSLTLQLFAWFHFSHLIDEDFISLTTQHYCHYNQD